MMPSNLSSQTANFGGVRSDRKTAQIRQVLQQALLLERILLSFTTMKMICGFILNNKWTAYKSIITLRNVRLRF